LSATVIFAKSAASALDAAQTPASFVVHTVGVNGLFNRMMKTVIPYHGLAVNAMPMKKIHKDIQEA
jgi:hypothetical protein